MLLTFSCASISLNLIDLVAVLPALEPRPAGFIETWSSENCLRLALVSLRVSADLAARRRALEVNELSDSSENMLRMLWMMRSGRNLPKSGRMVGRQAATTEMPISSIDHQISVVKWPIPSALRYGSI